MYLIYALWQLHNKHGLFAEINKLKSERYDNEVTIEYQRPTQSIHIWCSTTVVVHAPHLKEGVKFLKLVLQRERKITLKMLNGFIGGMILNSRDNMCHQ